jgi:hypothetical protein
MIDVPLRLRLTVLVANTADSSIEKLVASAEGLGACWG